MDRVEYIINGRYSDGEFLDEISDLDDQELDYLLNETKRVLDGAKAKIVGAKKKFIKTGIAADPEWFSKCKAVVNIRKKHILMIEREVSLR